MSGSGTDKTKSGRELAGPVVILVEPQLGENIGMAARAMGNFGLSRLRIVNPRDGWPNVHAKRAASGADHILDQAGLFDTVEQAVADCTLLFATTARAHDQAKPVVAPDAAAREIVAQIEAGTGEVGIMFGRERYGLQNEEVALANRIVTFPVNPGFASLNLAQAVLLMGYEWFKLSTAGALPFAMPERSEPASQHQMQAFFDNLVRELDKVEFLRPAEKRDTMLVNLRNIFTRMDPTKQDMHTLHGVVMAIAEGRKGPAKGGVLDGEQATRLRALLAEHGQGATPSESGTVRGLARLLRRNPTDAERILWQALTTDRRFAGQFKRQTPVGRHIPDFVSFVHRLAIELVNPDETEVIAKDRAIRREWLQQRGYRVVDMKAVAIEADLATELDRLQSGVLEARQT
jgi:tRNA/rRNA methyltransferase